MDQNLFSKLLNGYQDFRNQYAEGNTSIMKSLSHGQQPKVMIVGCCDSRVDPALILQCDPGDLFITRNVANIIPPFEKDEHYHGTSAALEFAIRYLKVEHLILLGHSQCGGIKALISEESLGDDFITKWVSVLKKSGPLPKVVDECAKRSLHQSYQHCLTFPWIKQRVEQGELMIHTWFFEIESGQIYTSQPGSSSEDFTPLSKTSNI